MKVAFDLDGVLRDLIAPLESKYGFTATQWDWRVEGKDIYELMKSHYEMLTTAPTTKYKEVVDRYYAVPEIWTVQPMDWIEHTVKWINFHFPKSIVKVFSSGEGKEDWLKSYPEYILIEDTPNFKNYERVILIDQPYNRNVKTPNRVETVDQFDTMLKSWEEAYNEKWG